MYDIIIVGGGPAGLTAATYACRAGKSVLVLEKNSFGGQIALSPKVENFPGFLSVSGSTLAYKLLSQAVEQGAETELDVVSGIRPGGDRIVVLCQSGEAFQARAVILATGAMPRPLGLPREMELIGSGVSYCAVCDGAFYAGNTVAVYGGGNTALQDALLLSERCEKVYLIHRRNRFRGEEKLAEALRQKQNVELLMETSVKALLGERELEGILVERDSQIRRLSVSGLFVAVGRQPDNAVFARNLPLDPEGYAVVGEDCQTPTPGLFLAGDCRRKTVRQLTTAAADGAVAALAACRYLDGL